MAPRPYSYHEKDIYSSNDTKKSKGYEAMVAVPGVYNTHTCIDKAVHRRKRKVISQAFSDQAIRKFEPTMLKHVNIFLKELLRHASHYGNNDWSEPMDMTPCCKFLSLDIVSDFAFGQSLKVQTEEENRGMILGMRAASILSGTYAQYPRLSGYGLDRFLRFKGAWTRERFGRFMKGLVQARLGIAKDAKHDLFSFIIGAEDAGTGHAFTLDELWSESRLFMFAGKVQLYE